MNEMLSAALLQWKKIAKVIGTVNSVIILTIFYFLIISPIAIIRKTIKLFKTKEDESSFWLDYESP